MQTAGGDRLAPQSISYLSNIFSILEKLCILNILREIVELLKHFLKYSQNEATSPAHPAPSALWKMLLLPRQPAQSKNHILHPMA